MFCLYVYVRIICLPGTCGSQKRVLASLELELWMMWDTMWCWELNLGPLQEQQVLLIAEPALWPLFIIYLFAYLLTGEDLSQCVEVRRQLYRNWFFIYIYIVKAGSVSLVFAACWVWTPYPIPVLWSLPSISSTTLLALVYVLQKLLSQLTSKGWELPMSLMQCMRNMYLIPVDSSDYLLVLE